MSSSLPPFARQWMNQWRSAAVELARVRDEELRQLSDEAANEAAAVMDTVAVGESLSGLVIQQRWFMRQMLLEAQNPQRESGKT